MESSIAEFLARQSASEQLPRPFRFCFHSCQHSCLLGPFAPTYRPLCWWILLLAESIVGSCSEASYLKRNSAMDDSIGGS